MFPSTARLVIVFNGEIYNHHLLGGELLRLYGIEFKGHSDDEVLVNAIDTWGIETTLKKCIGIFAL